MYVGSVTAGSREQEKSDGGESLFWRAAKLEAEWVDTDTPMQLRPCIY